MYHLSNIYHLKTSPLIVSPLLIFLILMTTLKSYSSQSVHNGDKSICISDYRIQTKRVLHSLTYEEILSLEKFSDTPEEGLKILGLRGDTYAAIAEKVLRKDSPFPYSFYRKFILKHWINTVGETAIEEKFIAVGKQHYKQYIELLKLHYNKNDNTGSFPDSDQILNSYLNAVRIMNLPDITVFDAAWAASDKSDLITWEKLNDLHESRIANPSRACFDINREKANSIIMKDFHIIMKIQAKGQFFIIRDDENHPELTGKITGHGKSMN